MVAVDPGLDFGLHRRRLRLPRRDIGLVDENGLFEFDGGW